MISLFIDTSTSRLIISLFKDNEQIYIINTEAHNDLSSKVLPCIKDALDESDLKVEDIEKIYVVNGPGSFTGIRVGVTIAKTMAWSLNIPIYPVSELQLLATTSDKKYIVPMIDARRGYVYAGIYNNDLKSKLKDQYIKLDELKELVSKKYKVKDVEFVSYDDIENSIKPNIDIKKILTKVDIDSVKAHDLVPNYLKKTEAEEKLNDSKK